MCCEIEGATKTLPNQFSILGIVSITCKHLSNVVSNCEDQDKNVKEFPVE